MSMILLAADAVSNDAVSNATAAVSNQMLFFKNKLIGFGTDYGMQVIGAIIILIIGSMVARWVGGFVQRWLDKQSMEPPVRTLLVRLVKLVIMVFTMVMVLDKFGVPITALVAGIGVAGVGIGLATQGVLSNIVAGLTIIFTKPFRVGEYIELAGVAGQVKTVDIFTTTLTHSDMSRVVIPNRKIVGEILHNYGAIRQLDMAVGVAYGSNTKEVIALLREILSANKRVLKDPAPAPGVAALSDFSINIAVKPWVSVADFGAAQVEIYQAILDQFKAHEIEIPFPQSEVRMLAAG